MLCEHKKMTHKQTGRKHKENQPEVLELKNTIIELKY